MLFSKYSATWDKLWSDNVVNKRLVVFQSIAVACLSAAVLLKGHTVIIVPPVPLTGQAQISSGAADSNYKKSWGVFMAELMGNLTPESVDFVKKSLSSYLSPDLYTHLRESIDQQSQEIKEQGITASFSPKQVVFEAENNKVFVYGTSVTTGRGTNAQPIRVDRSYEFVVTISAYTPTVVDFNVYRGEPHTQEWIAHNPGLAKSSSNQPEQKP